MKKTKIKIHNGVGLFFILAGLLIMLAQNIQAAKIYEAPGGRVGTNYNLILPAKGGMPPYTWTISGGTLPPGLTLSNEGYITGKFEQAGRYTFTVQVLDAERKIETGQIKINVEPRMVGIAPLQLKSHSLPNAFKGKPYNIMLAAEGGVLPYEWTVEGNLSQGLSIDSNTGELSGTPLKDGLSTFIIHVKDAQATPAEDSKEIILTVKKPAAGVGDIVFFKPLLILAGLGFWMLFVKIQSIYIYWRKVPDRKIPEHKKAARKWLGSVVIIWIIGCVLIFLGYLMWGDRQWFLWLALILIISGVIGFLSVIGEFLTTWKGWRGELKPR